MVCGVWCVCVGGAWLEGMGRGEDRGGGGGVRRQILFLFAKKQQRYGVLQLVQEQSEAVISTYPIHRCLASGIVMWFQVSLSASKGIRGKPGLRVRLLACFLRPPHLRTRRVYVGLLKPPGVCI